MAASSAALLTGIGNPSPDTFAAAELVKKERAEGPVVLSATQKRAAHAPEPARNTPKPEPAQARRMEPEPPRRSLSR